MSLITLIVVIACVGLFVWFITAYVPMPAPFKNIIVVISVIAVLIMVLRSFGVFSNDLGRVRF